MGKVLIVDRVAGERELLRILLEHEGYEVLEASDVTKVVAIVRATQPNLVLLDMAPANPETYIAVREMRLDETLKDRAIIAVTDGTRYLDRDRLVDAGFSGYIAKPVVLRSLREQLTQLASLRRPSV